MDRALLEISQIPQSRGLDLVANLASVLGQAEVTGTVAVGMALARLRHRRRDWWLPLGVLAVTVVELALKQIVAQPGPVRDPSRSAGLPFLTLQLRGAFPSGHLARLAYLAAMWDVIPSWVRVSGVVLAVATTVYLAQHWPSDALGGILLGIGAFRLFGAIATGMTPRAPWRRKAPDSMNT